MLSQNNVNFNSICLIITILNPILTFIFIQYSSFFYNIYQKFSYLDSSLLFTFLLTLISYIIIKIIYYNYKSVNLYKHKNTTSLYAHFSEIDKYNYFFFPKLLLTHPIKYTLKKGQSLYIPKQWWHWVKTSQKTFAVNYWFNNKIEQKPFIFNHTIDFDINSLNEEIVQVWKSDENKVSFTQQFLEFYNSVMDNLYLITLDNYDVGDKNKNIKNKISKQITFPIDDRIQKNMNYDYNIWISSNKHDTGLHYDDQDGVLTVIDGEKDIILFPPSDSKYLYPYDNNYKWINTNNSLNFRYNSYKFFNKVKGVSSGELLYITCNNDKLVLCNISKLFYSVNKNLIWGFKKYNDDYRWEIYNYTLYNEPVKISSYDIYQNQYNLGEEQHLYFKLHNEAQLNLPFWGYGKYVKNNIIYNESKIFVIDYFNQFNLNYDSYMIKLDYDEIKERFRKIILYKYSCYEICVHNKNPNEIFVQYLGISNTDFLKFLITNSYPIYVIDYVKKQIENNNYNINNEITIVYDIETQSIIRSGFYGVL